MSITDILEEAKARIGVEDEVLRAARERRDLIRMILKEEFSILRAFGSGSVAHGTQNRPLDDADLGLVLDRRSYPELGPDGDGPKEIAEKVRTVLRDRLKEDYPEARFYLGGRRAIKVTFNDPVGPDADDFTADVIVALTREDGGLWIPNLKKDEWEPSDPEKHTEMVLARNKDTKSTFARVIRLAKHANKTHGKKICSFNVTALGLECIEEKVSMQHGLATLLRHAADGLKDGLTQDPAGVSGSIGVNTSKRKEAADKLKELAEIAEEAVALEADGQTAQAQKAWSQVLPGAVDPPDDEDLKAEYVPVLDKSNGRVRQGVSGMVVSDSLGKKVTSGRAFGGKAEKATRLGLPWWREDVGAQIRMQAGLRRIYPDIEKRRSRGSLAYSVDLEVPCYETRRVTIVFEARYTAATVRVLVDGPSESRHRYEDGALCMWRPGDPADLRWTPEAGLADLIEMTRRHLFREAFWRETGKWLGPEVHVGAESLNAEG